MTPVTTAQAMSTPVAGRRPWQACGHRAHGQEHGEADRQRVGRRYRALDKSREYHLACYFIRATRQYHRSIRNLNAALPLDDLGALGDFAGIGQAAVALQHPFGMVEGLRSSALTPRAETMRPRSIGTSSTLDCGAVV